MSGPKICFVIGGPGSGKGTQCEMLVAKYGVAHFSSGDLLRAEVASGSERGQQLSATMAEGKLVSMDVVIQLLKEAVDKSFAEHPDKIILLDGFPREIEQATKFEEKICPATYVLSFDCSNQTMTERLLSRAKTSGRVDDNIETIKKRLVTFETATAPVLDYYRNAGAGLCILSLLASVILALLDIRASKILRKEASGTGESIKLSDITRFSAATWLIFAICVTYYVAIFPFISLGKLFFEQKFGLTQDEAGICNSLVYFIGAGASPIAGLLIDRYGRNVMWLLSAILITLGAYALLAFTFLHPYVAMVMMAIAYSMCASALWPMVSLVVPEYQLGTAYGMMQSIQNLGLALVSIAAGTIAEKYGYFLLTLQFMAWLALSAVFILILWVWDAGNGGYLNASPAKRKEMNQDEIRSVLEGEEYREPLISDGSVLDVSQTFRASTARELRNKYMGRIEGGKQQDFTRSAEFHRSLADQSINLGQSYQFSSNANRGLLK